MRPLIGRISTAFPKSSRYAATIAALFCLFFLPGVAGAGAYVLSEIQLSGYDTWEDYPYSEHPMWPLADTHTHHYEGAYFQDVTVSTDPGGSIYGYERIQQTPAGLSVVTTTTTRLDWEALPVVITAGQKLSRTVRGVVNYDGYPLGAGAGMSFSVMVDGAPIEPPVLENRDIYTGAIGTYSAEAAISFTVFEGNPGTTLKFHIRGTAPSAVRRFVYVYTWTDEIDGSGKSWGTPGDNRYTSFDEWKGAGVCSAMGLPTYWVNTSNLNLVVKDTDFSYEGLGPPVSMTRTYNSRPGPDGMFGNGWSFAYESRIVATDAGVLVKKGSGQVAPFWAPLWRGWEGTPVVATPPPGVFDTLVWYGDYWILTDKDSRLKYKYVQDPGASGEYRLVSVTDPFGNAVRITYNANGMLLKVTDAAGRVTAFAHNADKRCARMTAPDGREASYAYDAVGNLTQTTDFIGNISAYSYGPSKYMTGMTAAGKTSSFAYGEGIGGKVISSVTDAAGRVTKYSDSNPATGGKIVKTTDPRGKVTSHRSLEGGETALVTDPLGKTIETTFENGLPTKVKDKNGRTIQFQYDDRGNIVNKTDPYGKATVFVYNASDNLVRKTDPLGGVWKYGFSGKGRLLSATSPLGGLTTMSYDARGQLLEMTDSAGRKKIYTHDAFGNVTSLTDALGASTLLGYDAFGLNLTSTTDPRGFKTRFERDGNGRLTRVIHPDGSSRTYGYDGCSQVSITDENGHTATLARTPLLHPKIMTDALGGQTEYWYDGNGNETKMEGPRGKVTLKGYDGANRNVWIEDALGGRVSKSFDGVGNWTSVTDERGAKTKFAYDRNGRVVSTTDPLGAVSTLKRDALERVTEAVDARGGKVLYSYDADGRMVRKTFDGTAPVDISYDGSGDISSVTDSSGTQTFTRDAAGRVKKIVYPDGKIVTLTRDKAGNIKTLTYPGGLKVVYSYDKRNRATSVAFGAHTITRAWDAAGNLTGETRSNGTSSSYGHDANNRMTALKHLRGSTPFVSLAYMYDSAGNLVKESGSRPLEPTLDVSSTSAVFNAAGQIITRGPDSYTYDADGNLTGITGSGSFSASYNRENRPTTVSRGGVTYKYAYDAFGAVVRRSAGSTVRFFHYDDSGRLLFETDGTGAVRAKYIYAGRQLTAMASGAGVYFYHFDHMGSALALTGAGGDIKASYAYLPYRGLARKTGTVANPYTYIGAFGVRDEGGGFYYMRNRFYDGVTGRFIQKDPLGPAAGTNLYAYAGDNPVTRIDPLGYMGIDLGDWKFWVGSGMVGLGSYVVWANPIAGGALIVVGGALDAYSIKEAGKETADHKIKSLSSVLLKYEQNSVIRWDPTAGRYEVTPRCDWLFDYQYDEREEARIRAQVEIYNRLVKKPAHEVLKERNLFSR